MDWQEQAEQMMSAWADAQQRWWETWGSMTGAGNNPVAPMMRMFEQWREMMAGRLRDWPGDDPITRQVAGQVLASQSALMKFVEMAMSAWTELAPKIEAGEDWNAALQAYMERVRESFSAAQTGSAEATGEMSRLWSLYIEEWSRLGQLWAQPFQGAPWSGAMQGRSSDVIEMTNLFWDAFERTFGALLESPALGYTRELNEQIAGAFDTWLDYRRASAAYQAKLGDIWTEAFEQLLREMAEMAEQGQTIESVRDLLLLWGQVADRVFVETFRTEEYVRTQGELLNAAMAYRIRQREIMEIYLQSLDLPTRSEVDEAHRNIYELRKEVKALRRALEELQKKPARRSSSRRKKAAAPKPAETPDTAASTDTGEEE